MKFLHEITIIFLQISRKPQLSSRNYIFRKPTNKRFQQYIVRTEILSTSHAQVKYKNTLKIPFKQMGAKNPDTSPSP